MTGARVIRQCERVAAKSQVRLSPSQLLGRAAFIFVVIFLTRLRQTQGSVDDATAWGVGAVVIALGLNEIATRRLEAKRAQSERR